MSRGADVLGSWPEGVVLPPYSPWRRIPEWEPRGRWLRDRPQVEWPDTVFSVTRAPWLLRLMLAAGLALGLPTMGGGLGRHLLVVALTLVLWGWIEWWQTWNLSSLDRRLAVLGVQLVLIAAIIVICPLGGIIIWTHYMICGTFFTGPWLLATLSASCVLIAAVQVGGFDRLLPDPTLSFGLFIFDLAIGIVSITLANRREEAVLRRNETTRRLLIEQQRNEDLHDRLLDQAREVATREERARLARDLHDTVAQGLVAVVTQLEAIPDSALTDVSARRRVDNAKALAREGLGEARRAVNALRPAALDQGSLPEAVGRMLDDWSRVHSVAATLTVSGDPRLTAADGDLIRVVQEALSNVARHASAHQVSVSVDYLDVEVLLDIHDDGVGFNPTCTDGPTAAGGHGLPGMAERLRGAAGSLAVESEPGAGCVVSAAVPG
jgi:signal transduction histidine kinase